MRRAAAIALGVLAVLVVAVLGTGASDGPSGKPRYEVELDNAFGLVEGGDVKVAGVRAGQITKLTLDRATNRALAEIRIDRGGFGGLRTDVRCEARPQSLIGEYFLDCLPGTAAAALKPGSRIGVDRTASSIGPDLVNDILRRPYRERLSIILGELGAAVAGNGRNLNDAIRRAAPALRQTDQVLATLAAERRTIADLTTNADRVVSALAANRRDVGRFVQEARDTATVSATRRPQIAAGLRRLPGFLSELTPTMAALGRTADAQAPTLRNLRVSAPQLTRFFGQLAPFAQASTPALKALGKASVTGRAALTGAVPTVSELRRFSKGTPELAKNLAITLEHLDDPAFAAEDDPRAARATGRPAPTGYTGLEALLTYVFDQNQAVNVYDQTAHILKISAVPLTDECADYADVARAKLVGKRCAAALGPNLPGITFEDPTAGTIADPKTRAVQRKRIEGARAPEPGATGAPAPTTGGEQPAAPAPSRKPKTPTLDLPPLLPGLPDPPPVQLPLLDYLLGQGT